ncbi:nicotinate-nucleotide adenylyltransferase [Salibacterium aidingense]|uniref:nicotinate-nucleotide adenylyltransferase n=1 Tax=Salibacterium aidingense TaxID=384933 RepID=UPI003BD29394
MTKKIGLLGGTFDPPHNAHLMMAQETLITLELDEVWFIPVYSPPHKTREHMALPEERLDMTKRAIIDNSQFYVSTVELDRKGPSYTLDTVKGLKHDYPEAVFYFIIGGDMAASLESWKNIEELKEAVIFAVVDRPGYSVDHLSSRSMKYIEMPQVDISSTMIRERIRNRNNIRYYIPDSVWKYIEEHQVYG